MDLTAAYMAAAIVNKQQDSKPTVGKQDKTNPTGEVFNDYQSNTATGDYSHAEGYSTTASGGNSHAEGDYATASGPRSHAEGRYTIAASDCQHVQGKYNVKDSEGKYAFIIGNGTSYGNRSNALAIDCEGKIYINNSSVGIDLNNLLTRIEALENKKNYTIETLNNIEEFKTLTNKTADWYFIKEG